MRRLENIFLLRHAHSQANADKRVYRDLPDHAIPLSERGKMQAYATGENLAAYLAKNKALVDAGIRIWCSPYLRARETRDLLLDGMGAARDWFRDSREHILLTEQNFGLFDGLSDDECREKYPDESRRFDLCIEYNGKFYSKPPEGESRYDVCVRVNQFFGTIIRDAEKSLNPVSNVLVISHGTTLRAFAMMWLHKRVEWFETEPNPANCSLRCIGRNENGKFTDKGYLFEGFE
jgi:2,3-bisphosphoglycerate-dependent phosphoglycerate mutase